VYTDFQDKLKINKTADENTEQYVPISQFLIQYNLPLRDKLRKQFTSQQSTLTFSISKRIEVCFRAHKTRNRLGVYIDFGGDRRRFKMVRESVAKFAVFSNLLWSLGVTNKSPVFKNEHNCHFFISKISLL